MFHRYKLNIFGFFCFFTASVLFFIGYFNQYATLARFFFILSGIFTFASAFFVLLMLLKRSRFFRHKHRKVVKKHHTEYREMTLASSEDLQVVNPVSPEEITAEEESDNPNYNVYKTYPKRNKKK